VTPESHILAGNFPNPFNPTTTIEFNLPQTSLVNVTIYSVTGSKVAQLVNGWRDAGSHQVTFEASDLASGMYLYRIQAGDLTANGKMLLVK